MGMSSLVEFNVSIDEKALTRQLDQLLDDTTMEEIQTVLKEMMDEYTPCHTGNLINSAYITPNYVGYRADYAREMYHSIERDFSKENHPKATAEWDKAMFADHGDEFIERVRQILIRRAKELYG